MFRLQARSRNGLYAHLALPHPWRRPRLNDSHSLVYSPHILPSLLPRRVLYRLFRV
jgi:hypothetical protein